MIYFDNAATTLRKPPEVATAVMRAMGSFGNPGRSFHSPAMEAAHCVYKARREIAKLTGLSNPLDTAFTSGATESLNLVMDSLVRPDDHVITSTLEHNSVLRPLYKTGCKLSFIPCDGRGRLDLDHLNSLLLPKTRLLVCTHGSNLTGAVTDTEIIRDFCIRNGLIFILDVSQTLGSIKTLASMADVLCFTGHKALMGPQGTGGIIVTEKLPFKLVKTGGSGSGSFLPSQSLEMPDLFEAGTINSHGLAGLSEGAGYINRMGIDRVREQENPLIKQFLEGIAAIPEVILYGPGLESPSPILPVAAINIKNLSAEETALLLWDKWQIATRPGSHCAPLVHKHFKTEDCGMVRFSFGLFNTPEEVKTALKALEEIACGIRTHQH